MTLFMFLFNHKWRISYLQLLLVYELLICRGTNVVQRCKQVPEKKEVGGLTNHSKERETD